MAAVKMGRHIFLDPFSHTPRQKSHWREGYCRVSPYPSFPWHKFLSGSSYRGRITQEGVQSSLSPSSVECGMVYVQRVQGGRRGTGIFMFLMGSDFHSPFLLQGHSCLGMSLLCHTLYGLNMPRWSPPNLRRLEEKLYWCSCYLISSTLWSASLCLYFFPRPDLSPREN